MRTLTFNKLHKNGWVSYKLTGVPGAVFIDKRMLSAETLANLPTSIEVNVEGMVEPGADAVEKNAEKLAKQEAREKLKAEKASKAAEKATAKAEKAQAALAKAQAVIDKARAAAGQTSGAAVDGQ